MTIVDHETVLPCAGVVTIVQMGMIGRQIAVFVGDRIRIGARPQSGAGI
jgi:hypothetical protein